MFQQIDLVIYKLRFLIAGILVVAILVLLSVLAASVSARSLDSARADTSYQYSFSSTSDNPNVVAVGFAHAADDFNQTVSTAAVAITNGSRPVATAATHSGTFFSQVGSGIVHNMGSGLMSVRRAAVGSAVAICNFPNKIMASISGSTVVSAMITPSEHTAVPIIDPNSPELFAARAALPAAKSATQSASGANSAVPQWPIHGAITTLFGVPELPYQAIHTGLDISDGQVPGVTPIKPFRPGRVVEVVHSSLGLGNHIVIDHGNGVTSVYGHLNSTSVQQGEEVDESTTLGYEGTTGVSTGTHLHFEIRVNGQAADPHNFISGQP